MKTPVYIKADAVDQLLLSELGIVTYHSLVQPQRLKKGQHETALVPSVRVLLWNNTTLILMYSTNSHNSLSLTCSAPNHISGHTSFTLTHESHLCLSFRQVM